MMLRKASLALATHIAALAAASAFDSASAQRANARGAIAGVWVSTEKRVVEVRGLDGILEPDADNDGMGDETQDPDGAGLGQDWYDFRTTHSGRP
jgi:hypothetical protein